MTVTTLRRTTPARFAEARFTEEHCRIDDFVALVDRQTDLADYPHAAEVVQNVLVYDADTLRTTIADPAGLDAVSAELVFGGVSEIRERRIGSLTYELGGADTDVDRAVRALRSSGITVVEEARA